MERYFILKTFTDDEAETCKRRNLPELIKCKDCKYYDNRTSVCSHLTGSIAPIVKTNDNWFCTDGQR